MAIFKRQPSKAQIVATLGPVSSNNEVFLKMAENGASAARLNMAWGSYEEKTLQIHAVRWAEEKLNRKIPIIADLPGPRIQNDHTHTYKKDTPVLTELDKQHMKFCIENGVDYFAMSFVGSASDVEGARAVVKKFGGKQPIIAKIERRKALENIEKIVAASDAVMVARGDLGNEVPLEQIPFAQAKVIALCNKTKKPVITATEMLLSMKDNPRPTRAEVTDVANAILQGSDAVMLSEETSVGKYPPETVAMMEKIVVEAEKHIHRKFNILTA